MLHFQSFFFIIKSAIGFNPNTLQKSDVHWDKRRAWKCQDEIERLWTSKITFFKISYRCVQLKAWASGDFPDRSWVDIFEQWIKSHWLEHSLSSDKEQSPWRHPGWSRSLSLSPGPPPPSTWTIRTHTRNLRAGLNWVALGFANGLGVDRGCKITYWQPSVRERNRNGGTFLSNLRVNRWHEQSQMILGDTLITFFSSRNLPDSTGSCRKWLDAIRVSRLSSASVFCVSPQDERNVFQPHGVYARRSAQPQSRARGDTSWLLHG